MHATAPSRPRKIAGPLDQARRRASLGHDEAARGLYLQALRRDPTDAAALGELASLALRSGHRSAARTAYEQAVRCHPRHVAMRVNLGNLLLELGDARTGRAHFAAALAVEPALAAAHQGLARALTELGEIEAAATHWQRGFAGHAISVQPCRGGAGAIPVLLLVCARGGNIPTRLLLDDRVFAITALYADFADPAAPLPPHALIVNAIGDADLCTVALEAARAIVARSPAPVINHPAAVAPTGRAAIAGRLGALPDVITPQIRTHARPALLADAQAEFPLLVRAPGYHTGQHFEKVERRADLAAAIAALPGEELLAIDYLDARGADGFARKYRVMVIDGALYPLHLAIAADWKVHYFTAAMADNPDHRAEEKRFLDDMPGVLGARAMAALAAVADTLGLDYAGIDFALRPDGAVLLFEANATMVIAPPDADPIWDYRREPIDCALGAARTMLLHRAGR